MGQLAGVFYFLWQTKVFNDVAFGWVKFTFIVGIMRGRKVIILFFRLLFVFNAIFKSLVVLSNSSFSQKQKEIFLGISLRKCSCVCIGRTTLNYFIVLELPVTTILLSCVKWLIFFTHTVDIYINFLLDTLNKSCY